MAKRNPNISKLQAGYLFPEINRRKNIFLKENPDAKLISLGIGNTTEPITPHIGNGLLSASQDLLSPAGYSGYGDEQGLTLLREKIAEVLYNNTITSDEVFISDGAKCDIGRLQLLFGSDVSIAVQDPSYPVYIDGSVIMGATGSYNSDDENFNGVSYMKCTHENNFFPTVDEFPKSDLIYICSPNNPTGAVATKQQLKELVDFAKANKSIIIFDAAYSEFVMDESLPKSIFEIEGSREVAIEVNSFSKSIGFTGVRLGWSVVPNELKFDDGTPVRNDWNRIVSTVFNGASNIVQKAGLASLEPQGIEEMKGLVSFYLENAKIINSILIEKGIKTYGGLNSPYIWAHFPEEKSWDVFERILTESHIITTPGAGFGPAGESFVRFSAFGQRDNVEEAVERLKKNL